MPGYPYHLVDVFTSRPFGGNQLAVFPQGAEVPESLYQSIAKELNLSETTFVRPARDEGNHFHVRIFTPGRELPMAGHPTIGTAYVLTRLGMFAPENGGGILRLEEGVGPVPVEVETGPEGPGLITMNQGLPQFGEIFAEPAHMAALISLEEAELLPDAPVQIVSCGVPFWFIPLRSLDAVRRATLRLDLWERHLGGRETNSVFLFSLETEAPETHVHARMFAPGFGIVEDPATGSAAGPLGCYLIRHGLLPPAPTVRLICEQGYEMGRPSLLQISIGSAGGEIKAVRVGGHTVYMGGGTLEL